MIFGGRWAGLSISQIADLLGFSELTENGLTETFSSKRRFCGPKYSVDARSQRSLARLVPVD